MRYLTRYFMLFSAICTFLYIFYSMTPSEFNQRAAFPIDPDTLQKAKVVVPDIDPHNNLNDVEARNNPNDAGIGNNANDIKAENNQNEVWVKNNPVDVEAGHKAKDVAFENNPNEAGAKDNPNLNVVDSERLNSLDTQAKDKRLKVGQVKDTLEQDDPELQGVPWDMFDAEAYIEKTRLKPGEDKYEKNKFNQEVSDNVKVNRSIPDTRHKECTEKTWRTDLPATSVIIIFHNEARSTLLRTVVSVLLRSPDHLIREIILVDDYSDDPRTGEELTAIAKVKLIRNKQREGLIRSRMTGADAAKAKILTFLDSHCECNQNWLEPLLERVAEDRSRVLSPAIDFISMDNFGYRGGRITSKGGFGWDLNFKWDFVTQDDVRGRSFNTAPLRTPAIAGGLFTIDKSWFEELGKYDPGMDVWGGENIEISLRVWLCHGQLEIIPCSRVGHVFRKQFPYKFPGGSADIVTKNKRRTAEVWLDDFKKYFFEAEPSAKHVEFGDVTERLELKRRLKCKPFKWFMDNVYRTLQIPDRKGMIKQGDMCLDTLGNFADGILDLFQCHGAGGNQAFSMSKTGQIRHADLCVTLLDRSAGSPVKLLNCRGEDPKQKWKRLEDPPMLQYKSSNLCLDASAMVDVGLSVKACDWHSEKQKWEFILFIETE